VPAYVLSELKVGFQIGAVLFLPFLIIDIVVASVSLSIGMIQLPPVMISAPFKDSSICGRGRLDIAGRFSIQGAYTNMTSGQVVDVLREALMAAFWLALPLLAVGFIAGILMSLAQVLTSIQDSAFSTVPRLLVYLAAIIVLLPWLVSRSATYTIDLITKPQPVCQLRHPAWFPTPPVLVW